MRQTLRSAIARRGPETIAWLAIGGTLAVMFFTAHQVRQGWEQRRLAAESAVREQLDGLAVHLLEHDRPNAAGEEADAFCGMGNLPMILR